MGTMPEKKTLTVQRVLALVIAYITLSVGGGVKTDDSSLTAALMYRVCSARSSKHT